MNEAQWQGCTEAEKLLDFLHKARERKLRLFAVAACRRLQWSWDRAVETAENYADGLVSQRELMEARKALLQNASTMYRQMGSEDVEAVEELIRAITEPHAAEAAFSVVEMATTALQRVTLCDLLREIFGDPFRPVTISPSWLAWKNGTITRLAQNAYDNRVLSTGMLDNTRLTILADALEEVGCTDETILMHLRCGGEHYRGCWAIDLLLGKN
jgi:hypothetical protein